MFGAPRLAPTPPNSNRSTGGSCEFRHRHEPGPHNWQAERNATSRQSGRDFAEPFTKNSEPAETPLLSLLFDLDDKESAIP